MRMCHFQTRNVPFSSQTTIITFIYLLALFTVKNLLKFLQQVQIYNNAPFLGPKWSSSSKQTCFGNHLSISPFHCAKSLKNSSTESRVIILIYLLAPFTVQNFKWPISPNENFFSENLLMSLVSFIHVYLHAKN